MCELGRKGDNGNGSYPKKNKQASLKDAALEGWENFAILQCSVAGGSEQYESFGGGQGALIKGRHCW